MNADRPDADVDDDPEVAVIAADDTGMLRTEQSIVQAEINMHLNEPEV